VVKLNWQPERKNRKAKPNRGTGDSDILAAHPSKIGTMGHPVCGFVTEKAKSKAGAPGDFTTVSALDEICSLHSC
jgi:hypothetical protein